MKKSPPRPFEVGDFVCARSPTVTPVNTESPAAIGDTVAHKIASLTRRGRSPKITLADHFGDEFYLADFRHAEANEVHTRIRTRSPKWRFSREN